MITPKRRRAAAPVVFAAVAALLTALAAGVNAKSSPRLDMDRTAEAVAEAANGRYDIEGMAGVMSRLDGAQLALALRHDPAFGPAFGAQGLPGLTVGWDSLRLGGKPDPFAQTINGAEAVRLNALAANEAGVKAAPPFFLRTGSTDDRVRAVRCLTQAVYYEAALEGDEGQAGVAQVVLNRVRDHNYPNSICGVVYQGAERNTGCQFTFTCDGSLARAPVDWAWRRAEAVARKALDGAVSAKVGSSTHYHADYVRPWWAPSLTRVTQSGAHIFYRWNGAAGSVASLTQAYNGREPLIDEARFARARDVMMATDAAPLVDNSAQIARQLLGTGNREVEFEGTTRIVGAPSLGGRRQPTAKEISDINERLKAFEAGQPASAPTPGPEG